MNETPPPPPPSGPPRKYYSDRDKYRLLQVTLHKLHIKRVVVTYSTWNVNVFAAGVLRCGWLP